MLLFFRQRLRRIQDDGPLFTPLGFGQDKGQRLIMGVEQDVKTFIDHPLTACVWGIDAFAVEEDADSFGKSLAPLFLGHFQSVRCEPADVRHLSAVNWPALKPAAPVKYR